VSGATKLGPREGRGGKMKKRKMRKSKKKRKDNKRKKTRKKTRKREKRICIIFCRKKFHKGTFGVENTLAGIISTKNLKDAPTKLLSMSKKFRRAFFVKPQN
jgi:hypothetical protein